ncbi:hypothetical protein M0Q97_06185 [Candidatus Dojkabacteria bacterium]|jgi:hypothetical protein|nr:hypothetical protein [Candidatus Dojkabacteria bacterium]
MIKYDNNYDEYDDENNPIEDIIERLNYCRIDYYKLYKKEFKVASVRLRHDLEYIIQTAKQIKRDALIFRKQIEEKNRGEEEDEIWN